MLRFLGVMFLIFCLTAYELNLSGPVTVALLFYGGCASILVGLIALSILRRL
jgi:hypothetical protein